MLGIGHRPMLARRRRGVGDTRTPRAHEWAVVRPPISGWCGRERGALLAARERADDGDEGTAEAASTIDATMLIQSCERAALNVSGSMSSRLPMYPIRNGTHQSHTMPVEFPVELRRARIRVRLGFGCPPPAVAHHERGNDEIRDRDEPNRDRPTRGPRSRRGVPQLGVLRRPVEVHDEHDEDRERDHSEDRAIALTTSSASSIVARRGQGRVVLEGVQLREPVAHAIASASALTIDAPSSHVSAVVSPASERYRCMVKGGAPGTPLGIAASVPGLGGAKMVGAGRSAGTSNVSARDSPPSAIHCVQRPPSQ